MERAGGNIVIIEKTKHSIVFDVRYMPPKFAVALTSAMTYDVPTLKIELPVFSPKTFTIMDYEQWATRLGHIALESRSVDQFNNVSDCTCESGGPCCEATLQIQVVNESPVNELNVWSDDIVSADPRVVPVHRTFSVKTIRNHPNGIFIETDVPNSFDVGSVISALDSKCSPPLPKFLRVGEILSPTTCILVRLLINSTDSPIQVKRDISNDMIGEMVAHVSNRQFLYPLAPNDAISVSATVRKGTGRQHIKWSPIAGNCSFRPLFRNMKPAVTQLSPEESESFKSVCPKNVFDIEDGFVHISRPDNCDACRRCERWAEEKGVKDFVKLPKNKLPEWHRFTVKTNGSLDADDVVRRAFKIIQERLTGRSEAAGAQLSFPPLSK